MKFYRIAAAALLIGTSAFAWAPKADTALDTEWEQTAPAAGDPYLDLATDPDAVAPEAAIPEAATPEPADAGPAGVGGPIETVETAAATTAAVDFAPRPAAQNYPPCSPGPGDDNCIQLYEPGVRMALASWDRPTGGLMQPGEALASTDAASEPATGVGGPYEPVEGATAETAMNGDGTVDPAVGETADLERSGA